MDALKRLEDQPAGSHVLAFSRGQFIQAVRINRPLGAPVCNAELVSWSLEIEDGSLGVLIRNHGFGTDPFL